MRHVGRHGGDVGQPRDGVYWSGGTSAGAPPSHPVDRASTADVCIVGGGFTGLWTALYVKELSPQTEVVLVEQFVCGMGASGRNGGWVNGWEDMFPTLSARFGAEDARWLVDARSTASGRSSAPCARAGSTAT